MEKPSMPKKFHARRSLRRSQGWRRPIRAAFTLVELLVVIAIISILAMLLSPSLKAARNSARGIKCMNNLKQMGAAMALYTNDYRYFPEPYYGPPGAGGSWYPLIFPYLPVIQWNATTSHWLDPQGIFRCPSDTTPGPPGSGGITVELMISYGYSYGAVCFPDPVDPSSLSHPASVVVAADSGRVPSNWLINVWPWPSGSPAYPVSSRHQGGSNALFADGSVRWYPLEKIYYVMSYETEPP